MQVLADHLKILSHLKQLYIAPLDVSDEGMHVLGRCSEDLTYLTSL